METTSWARWRRSFAGLLLIAALPVACRFGAERPKPNVVVILIEALRPDYLGFYGHEEENAPFLAELAEQGVVFDSAFSTSSWTAPSVSSLFTSLYPTQLPADVATLPELFQSMGYTTFGLSANINIGEEIGFSRWFDRFERDPGSSAALFLERITAWRHDVRQSEPFFLYVHFNDLERSYHKGSPYDGKQRAALDDRRARYLSGLSNVDEQIRKIYEMLDLGEDTVLVVLSDHGEEFGDHGRLEHRDALYIELNRVLMMIHAPFLAPDPMRVALNVSLLDVLPTLVEVAGGTDEESLLGREGVSLVPALRTSERTVDLIETLRRRIVFAHSVSRDETRGPVWAATLRHWKLIEKPDAPRELYNHRRDPREWRNLYSPHAEGIPVKLVEALEEFKKIGPAAEPNGVEVDVDPKLEEELRALGDAN